MDDDHKKKILLSTAIHEIGHAAAALLLGYNVPSAELFEFGALTAGTVRHTPKPEIKPGEPEPEQDIDKALKNLTWPKLLDQATMSAAGHAATDLILAPEKRETWLGGSDHNTVCACARHAIPTNCDSSVQSAFTLLASARARALLTTILPRIERCARVLLERKEMTPQEIVDALFPKQAKKDAEVAPCAT